MKKQILTLGILACSSILYAQPQQGRVLLGGNLGITNNKNTMTYNNIAISNHRQTLANISPTVEYFYNNRAAIGITFNLGFSIGHQNEGINDTTASKASDKSSSVGTGLYHNYYVPLYKTLYLGIRNEINVNMSVSRAQNTSGITFNNYDTQNRTASVNYGFKIGLVFFASDRLVLNTYINLVSFGIQHDHAARKLWTYDDDLKTYRYQETNNTSNSLTGSLINAQNVGSFSFGLFYYLGKKTTKSSSVIDPQ